MKRLSVSLIASLMILGLTVSANAGYAQNSASQRGQYQMRQTSTDISNWTPRFGVGFNRQMLYYPDLPVNITYPAGTGTSVSLKPATPADLSFRMYIGPIGGEFDLGGNQYAVAGVGDINVFNLNLKAFYTIINKTYVKFNGGMALMYSDMDAKSMGALIGTGVNFFAGPEFFIPQLPELGFNIELGLGYTSYSASGDHFAADNLGFNTSDFLQAGIHYYFN
jgi:hypothetical protein